MENTAAVTRKQPCCSICGKYGHNKRKHCIKCPVGACKCYYVDSVKCGHCGQVGHSKSSCKTYAVVKGQRRRAAVINHIQPAVQRGRALALIPKLAQMWSLPVEVQAQIERYCYATVLSGNCTFTNMFSPAYLNWQQRTGRWTATYVEKLEPWMVDEMCKYTQSIGLQQYSNRRRGPKGLGGGCTLSSLLGCDASNTYFGNIKCEAAYRQNGIKIIGINPANPVHLCKRFSAWRKKK
jgi:hypothetical protein